MTITCVKCGETTEQKPKYESYAIGDLFTEWLFFTCEVCGYTHSTPTKDQEEAKKD